MKDYTCPAIKYEDGTYSVDSWQIAQELERRYPTPSLHLDDPVVFQVREHITKLMHPLVRHILPKIALILPERSADYFYETREEMFGGVPLAEVDKTAGEEDWEKAAAPAKEAGDLSRKKGGPFFLGEVVSYADFIFVSMLQFIKSIDRDGTLFERYLAHDSAFSEVYEASKQWLEKQD